LKCAGSLFKKSQKVFLNPWSISFHENLKGTSRKIVEAFVKSSVTDPDLELDPDP